MSKSRGTRLRKHPGGRPLVHGVELKPFAFRMPSSVRERIDALAASAEVPINDVLLVALSSWLASRPSAAEVRAQAHALSFSPTG